MVSERFNTAGDEGWKPMWVKFRFLKFTRFTALGVRRDLQTSLEGGIKKVLAKSQDRSRCPRGGCLLREVWPCSGRGTERDTFTIEGGRIYDTGSMRIDKDGGDFPVFL